MSTSTFTSTFTAVLSRFATGVAVVTACESDGRPVGMAVQSFSSVSLDPPLVCFCPARTSAGWPRVRAAGAFVVNILAADQRELCRAFAVTGGDKFAGIPWRPAGNGAPLLDGVLASVECELADVLDGGDHAIALGRVTALTVHRDDAAPLLYFRRSYGRLSPGSRPSRPAASASMSSSMAAARSRSEA
ncbi:MULTISPECIES: flavin reductase family protein [Streptomyces]|uniref:flavin reductase family protein n=1 Tax=Streptomyces TaxID=1883 RepID=UPI0031B9FB8C